MQGIGDEGEADWMSTDVGAAVGVFEVPSYMPCYEAATTTSGSRSPREEVCYLINTLGRIVMPFVIHRACVYKLPN